MTRPNKPPDYGAIESDSPDVYIPSPAEIERVAAEIRQGWQQPLRKNFIHCTAPRSSGPRIVRFHGPQ